MEKIEHTIKPVYDKDSRILMLGTMPSPKSREAGFFYSHPRNRLWQILADIFKEPVPQNNKEKTELLLKHRIAMWDVLKSCIIKGAEDASIRMPVANNLEEILSVADIRAIFTTGTAATKLYRRFCLPQSGIEPIPLPSTSPANCRFFTYDELVQKYRIILNYLY